MSRIAFIAAVILAIISVVTAFSDPNFPPPTGQPLCPPGFQTIHNTEFCDDAVGRAVKCKASFTYKNGLQPFCDLWKQFEYVGFLWDPTQLSYTCPNGSMYTTDPQTNKRFCLWLNALPNPNVFPFDLVMNCGGREFQTGEISFSYGLDCQQNINQLISDKVFNPCAQGTVRAPASTTWCRANGRPDYIGYDCAFPKFPMPSFARSWCGTQSAGKLAVLWSIKDGNSTCVPPSLLGTDGLKARYCQWPGFNNTFVQRYGEEEQWCDDVKDGLIGYSVALDCKTMMEYFFAPNFHTRDQALAEATAAMKYKAIRR
jgi:hypothetical protein